MNTTTSLGSGGESAGAAVPSSSGKLPRPRGRVISLVAGIALLVAGLIMLASVAWEYWGTNIVAKRNQADIREEIHAKWEYPTLADLLGPQSSSASLGSADALVRIPAFGSDYEVPLIEGVRDGDLSRGIGHFPGTGPGQIGNFALAAHRVTNGEPFHDLPDLRPGDKVVVETSDAIYTYVLDTDANDLVVPFTSTWVIDAVPVAPEGEAPPGMPTFEAASNATRAIITLTTCSELFHTDDRMVAFGHLASTTPK
jgi:sortase A